MKLISRSRMPDDGEALRLVIVDQDGDDDVIGLVVTDDGTARMFTWPDGEEANAVELPIRKPDLGTGTLAGVMVPGDPVGVISNPPQRVAGPPIVVVTRPSDSSNEHVVFGGPVEVYDIDLGYSDLRDADEFLEWAQGHLEAAQAMLDQHGPGPYGEAAAHIRSTVEEMVPRQILEAGHWMGGDTTYEPGWGDIVALIEAQAEDA